MSDGMPMPGGWTMTMVWMPPPGQTWPHAAASFLGMWIVMMVAMMLPALVPALWRYRAAIGPSRGARLAGLTAIAGTGYFCAWMFLGAAIFPLGLALAAVQMRQPALARLVPAAAGAIVVLAGAVQFTGWKARHLACCRLLPPEGVAPASGAAAWRGGLYVGGHCVQACAGWTAILLAAGMMDPRAMAAVTAAITAERVAPAGVRVAQTMGVAAIVTGLLVMAGVVRL
jgi:predicted metal-binding membrane protein